MDVHGKTGRPKLYKIGKRKVPLEQWTQDKNINFVSNQLHDCMSKFISRNILSTDITNNRSKNITETIDKCLDFPKIIRFTLDDLSKIEGDNFPHMLEFFKRALENERSERYKGLCEKMLKKINESEIPKLEEVDIENIPKDKLLKISL